MKEESTCKQRPTMRTEATATAANGRSYIWDAYSATTPMKACAERRTVLLPLRTLLGESGACEPYGSVRRDAADDGGETSCREACEELHVGQVPYAMRPDTLRWVLRELTGVTALKVEQRREPKTRGRTGLFTVRVRAQDVDAVVAWHRRALCCPEFLWVPLRGCAEEAEALCARLKGDGIGVKNGLLSIERRRLKPGTVPVEEVGLHIIESEARRPLLWQTLRVRNLCAPTRVRGDESLTCQMIQ